MGAYHPKLQFYQPPGGQRAPIWWPKATSPLQELEGGAFSAPKFNLTTQVARRALIWWLKATSPLQEQETWPLKGAEPSSYVNALFRF